MNLVEHLTLSLQEQFHISEATARQMAASIDQARIQCDDTQCHDKPVLSEELLVGVLADAYAREERGSIDTRAMAKFIVTEEKAYRAIIDRWGGRFHAGLAKDLREKYKMPRMMSYMMSAAFMASGAGYDYRNDAHNIDQLKAAMTMAYDEYGHIVENGTQGQVPKTMPDNMAELAEFSFERLYGVKVYDAQLEGCAETYASGATGRVSAMQDPVCVRAAQRHFEAKSEAERMMRDRPVISRDTSSPSDFVTVEVPYYESDAHPGEKRYDTRAVQAALDARGAGAGDGSAGGTPLVAGMTIALPFPGEYAPSLPNIIPESVSIPSPVAVAGELTFGAGVGAFVLGALNSSSPQVQQENFQLIREAPWEQAGTTTVQVCIARGGAHADTAQVVAASPEAVESEVQEFEPVMAMSMEGNVSSWGSDPETYREYGIHGGSREPERNPKGRRRGEKHQTTQLEGILRRQFKIDPQSPLGQKIMSQVHMNLARYGNRNCTYPELLEELEYAMSQVTHAR